MHFRSQYYTRTPLRSLARNIREDLNRLYSPDVPGTEDGVESLDYTPVTLEEIQRASAESVDRAPLITAVSVEGAISFELKEGAASDQDTLEICIGESPVHVEYGDTALNADIRGYGGDCNAGVKNAVVATVDEVIGRPPGSIETRSAIGESNSPENRGENILTDSIVAIPNHFQESAGIMKTREYKSNKADENGYESVFEEFTSVEITTDTVDIIETNVSITESRVNCDEYIGIRQDSPSPDNSKVLKDRDSDSKVDVKEVVSVSDSERDIAAQIKNTTISNKDSSTTDEKELYRMDETIRDTEEPHKSAIESQEKRIFVEKDNSPIQSIEVTTNDDAEDVNIEPEVILVTENILETCTNLEVESLDNDKLSDSDVGGTEYGVISASYDVTASYDIITPRGNTEADVSIVLNELIADSDVVNIESAEVNSVVVEDKLEGQVVHDNITEVDEDLRKLSINKIEEDLEESVINSDIVEVNGLEAISKGDEIDNGNFSVNENNGKEIISDVIDLNKVDSLVESIIDKSITTLTSEQCDNLNLLGTAVPTNEYQLASTDVPVIDHNLANTDVLKDEHNLMCTDKYSVEENVVSTDAPSAEDNLVSTDAPSVEDNLVSTDAPSVEENLVSTDAPSVEDNLVGTDAPSVEENVVSTDALSVEENLVSTDALSVEENLVSTDAPKVEDNLVSTDAPSVEENVVSTDALSVEENLVSTDALSVEENLVSTDAPKVEDNLVSTDAPSVEENVVSTDALSVEENLVSTDALSVEENLVSTDAPKVEDNLVSTDALSVEDNLVSTDAPSVEENVVSTDALSVEENLVSTDAPKVEDNLVSTDALSVEDNLVSTDAPSVEENVVSTDAPSVEDNLVSTDALSVEENVVSTDALSVEENVVSTDALSVEENVVSTDVPSVEDNLVSTDAPSVEENLVSTDAPSVEDNLVSTDAPSAEDNVVSTDELSGDEVGADVPTRKLSMADVEYMSSAPQHETVIPDIAAEDLRLPEITEIRVDFDPNVDQEVRVEQIDFTAQDEGNLSPNPHRAEELVQDV